MRRRPSFELPELEVELLEVELLELTVEPTYRHARGDLLSVAGLDVRFANRRVVHDVTLRVAPGEVVALIGHNGCGKSSTLRAIFGLTPPAAGDVVIDGTSTTGWRGPRRALGVGFVPASDEVFADVTVRDNLVLAAGRHCVRDVVAARIEDVLATFPGLRTRLEVPAGVLSGGEQRMVGIAIAMMTEPRLLLLDEPSKHLAPALATEVLATVRALAEERHIGVLIAEVNLAAALAVADRAYVMRSGEIVGEHVAQDLLAAGPLAWWKLF